MKDLIKEVALEGAEKFGVVADDSEIVDLVTWCVAELSKRAEASCVAFQHEDTGRTTSVAHNEADDFERLNQRWFKVGPLFTFPPIHDIAENQRILQEQEEAIENRTAEAICKQLSEWSMYETASVSSLENGGNTNDLHNRISPPAKRRTHCTD